MVGIKETGISKKSMKSPSRPTMKSPGRPSMKSPGRLSMKSPKSKKSSIKIESNVIKPVYKNKLQAKTKFKFPPKKPVVKKSTAKLTLAPSAPLSSKFVDEISIFQTNLQLLQTRSLSPNPYFNPNPSSRKTRRREDPGEEESKGWLCSRC